MTSAASPRPARRRLLLETLENRQLLAGEVFPNDPLFSSQWPLHNTGQTGGAPDADIDAPEAWSVTTGSMATVVAVLDSGIDYTHPDLYLNIWLNEAEIPAGIAANLTDADSDGVITFRDLNAPANASYVTNLNANSFIDGGDLLADPAWENGLDEDGNGLTDDLIGWDFHNDDNDPQDETGHGTSVSQRLAANGNDGIGMVGVMWAARLMPVRIELINETRFIENCAAGLDYAVAEGATISNNSWGDFIYSQVMFDAIDRARLAGHLFIASAGNDSQDIDVTPRYPASYNLDNVLSVHAVGATDQLTPAGNWGQVNVDLGSPTDTGANSQATPRVTGVAGLLRTLHPDWTYTQIKDRILATVDQLPSLAGKSVTGGRLNAAGALGVVNVSISEATATEGSSALKFINRFVSEAGPLWARAGTFGPDGNGDGAADFYLPTVDTSEVLRYDGVTGAFLDVFIPAGSGGLNSPGDLEFVPPSESSPDGLLYVTSTLGNQLLRYNASSGVFVDVAASGLALPFGISLGPDGSLYIANQLSNEVLRYDGSALSVFVAAGSGGLAAPRLGLFGPDANGDGIQDLYVAAQDSHQIHRYSGVNGAPISAFVTTDPTAQGPTWLGFGTQGDLYLSVRTTSFCCDTSINRYDLGTGALLQSYALGRDGWSFTVGPDGLIYDSTNGDGNFVERFGPSSLAAFTVTLSSASDSPVTVNYSTANGTATAGDFTAASGTITFAPGQTSQTIRVQTLDDAVYEGNETFVVNLSNPSSGAIITDTQGVATITDNDLPSTKFYVVDDASANRTFEYASDGTPVENYTVASGNTAPRGAASNLAGDKVWVVDANRNVYVYNPSGALLGSWSVGGFNNSAQFVGIATNGTDIWIVDAKSDKVYRFTGAASRTSGSQGAASSFALNSGNKDASDLVTDGTSIWVLNNTSTDKVFKYTVGGTLLGSWTISSGGGSPTGITIDPANISNIWIVDNASDRVYQFDAAANRTSGSQSPSTSFALAAGNTNPQGLADPPVPRQARSASEGLGISTPATSHDTALLAITDELQSLLSPTKRRR